MHPDVVDLINNKYTDVFTDTFIEFAPDDEETDASQANEVAGASSSSSSGAKEAGAGEEDQITPLSREQFDRLVGHGQLNGPFKGICWRNLDGDQTSAAVKILPIVAAAGHKRTTTLGVSQSQYISSVARPDIRTLTPLLRLVSACSKSTVGDLGEMDAMIGCPMLCVDTSDLLGDGSTVGFDQLPTSAQETVALCHLYTADWCIEVVNMFVQEQEGETRAKVCSETCMTSIRLLPHDSCSHDPS